MTHHACTCIQCCNARTVQRREAAPLPANAWTDEWDVREHTTEAGVFYAEGPWRVTRAGAEADIACARRGSAEATPVDIGDVVEVLMGARKGAIGVVESRIPTDPPYQRLAVLLRDGAHAWPYAPSELRVVDRQRRESPTPVEAALEGYTPFSKRPRSKALERLAVEARNYWDANDDGHRCAYGDLCPSCEVRDALDVLDALEKGTLDASVSNASETPSGRAEMGSDAASAGARAAPSRARGVGGVDAGPLEGREAVAAEAPIVSQLVDGAFRDGWFDGVRDALTAIREPQVAPCGYIGAITRIERMLACPGEPPKEAADEACKASEPDWKDHYARVASSLGITYDCEGQGSWPGPIDAVLSYIEELKVAHAYWVEHRIATRCGTCDGDGQYTIVGTDGPDEDETEAIVTCDACNGTGKDEDACSTDSVGAESQEKTR